MKKRIAYVGLCLAVAASAVFAACSNGKNGNKSALSTNDVYGMGAVSSVRLLESNLSAKAVKAFTEANKAAQARSAVAEGAASTVEGDTEAEVKIQTERFNEYFTALDSFLGDDVISTVTEANTDVNYQYDTKMTVNGKNFDGETVTYTMYYTETLKKVEKDDDEEEREYVLEGVMSVDGADYRLEGERSAETEKDETETELKIRAYADIADKTTYIQMEQEYSVEEGETETEYVYSVYKNGVLLEQTAVEFETENENNKVETEYELEFISGESKGRYVVEREVKDGKTTIKVKYDIGGKTGVFRISEIIDGNGEKQYEYSYSDGSKKVFD